LIHTVHPNLSGELSILLIPDVFFHQYLKRMRAWQELMMLIGHTDISISVLSISPHLVGPVATG